MMKIEDLLESDECIKIGIAYVYKLYEYGECVYVGKTINIKNRIADHKNGIKKFSEVSFVKCEEKYADEIEVDTIIINKPKLNRILPKTDKYISLSFFGRKLISSIIKNNNLFNIVFSIKTGQTRSRYITTHEAEKIIKGFGDFMKEREISK